MARRTSAEIQEMVLNAAVDLVYKEGLGLGTEAITYSRVFRHLEQTSGEKVTRASVHERIWADQAAFQAALRTRLVSRPPNHEIAESTALVRSLIDASLESASVRETARLIVQGLADIDEGLADDEAYHARTTIRGLMVSATPEELRANPDLTTAVVATVALHADLYQALFKEAIHALGVEVRPELGLEEAEALRLAARMLNTFSAGVGLRDAFDPEPLKGISVALGGPESEWNFVGLAGWAILNQFFIIPEDD